MSEPTNPSRAWQPITFRGVAAFARSSHARVMGLALMVGLLVAATTIWFLAVVWAPAIEVAISRLPDQGRIRHGQLEWPYSTPALLAESSFITILIDPDDLHPVSRETDLQVKFRNHDLKLASLFGAWVLPYRAGYRFELNRPEVQPAWGAWKPPLLAIAGAGALGAVSATWLVLAWALAFPTRLLAFFCDRSLDVSGAFRLSLAGLMPGGLVMIAALLLYSVHRLNLIGLLAIWSLHLLIALVYIPGAVRCLPRLQGVVIPMKNPFAAPAPAPTTPAKNPGD